MVLHCIFINKPLDVCKKSPSPDLGGLAPVLVRVLVLVRPSARSRTWPGSASARPSARSRARPGASTSTSTSTSQAKCEISYLAWEC